MVTVTNTQKTMKKYVVLVNLVRVIYIYIYALLTVDIYKVCNIYAQK